MEQQLNRECSLFTEDGRFVIVGSAAHIPDDLRPHFYNIHSNNEAVTPTIRYIYIYIFDNCSIEVWCRYNEIILII